MKKLLCLLIPFLGISSVQSQILPEEIQFIRQGAQRLIFDEEQSITMAKLEPKNIIGLSTMHPQKHYGETQPEIQINQDKLNIKSEVVMSKPTFGLEVLILLLVIPLI